MAGAFLGGMTTEAIGFAPSLVLSPLTTLIGSLVGLGVGVKDKALRGKHEAKFKALVRDLFKQFMDVFAELHRQVGDDDEKVLRSLQEMLLSANEGFLEHAPPNPDFTEYFNHRVGVNTRQNGAVLVENLNIAARVLTVKKVVKNAADFDKLAKYFGIPNKSADDAINFVTALYFLSKNSDLNDVFSKVVDGTLISTKTDAERDDL
jgi:hypothetical protein